MSNKSQLQANNTQLASLIQTLQGKIAGGGGGVRNIVCPPPQYAFTIPVGALNGEFPTKAAYIGAWDDIDFDAVTPSNFATAVILQADMNEIGISAAITFETVLGLEYGIITYTKHALSGCEFLHYAVEGEPLPIIPLAKLNETFLSTIGAEGEPGIYALGLPDVGIDNPVSIFLFET